jgi:RNA recognition motif-containing protein
MANKVYVGNLPFSFTAQDLQKLFGTYGAVRSAEVIMDRVTGRSRGFGFVEMETPQATQDAIAGLNEKDMEGRTLTVNEARERTPRGPGGAGGRGGYGGGGGGGGGGHGGYGGGGGGRGGDRGDRHGDGDRGGRGRDRDSGYDR